MKLKIQLITVLLGIVLYLNAQTQQDSVVIKGIKWETKEIKKGIVHKHAQVQNLYKGIQNINIIEVDMKIGKYKAEIIETVPNRITSETAKANHAFVAINGSYFNVKKGNSVCFFRVGKELKDTTTVFEFAERITGAIFLKNGKIQLKAWEKANENKKFNDPKLTILAAGPLMILDGRMSDFSMCKKKFIETKHPRSAIAITNDMKLLMISVDGRHPNNADGVNMQELTHLIKMVGGHDAINLDGGGSTTLWSYDATGNGVLNKPSDNKVFDNWGERKVANIVIVK
ncbi:MAG: phosphodiester glycosidase family protein [Paludibacter sp.]|nr:phosphodiester glycosidase family protein [Paludibacter sp.]